MQDLFCKPKIVQAIMKTDRMGATTTNGGFVKRSSIVFAQIIIALAAWNANAATYYVRTDGGDASQCTGKSNAAYPGSGSAQACAWKNPNIAMGSSSAKIVGGDTLVINGGTYAITSYMTVPSGNSSTARTRILGANCAVPAKLVGQGGLSRILNLDSRSYVEVGCLDLSDNSECISSHPSYGCASGAGAKGGIMAVSSNDVWLHDLNIHGFSSRGIQAGGISNWTVDRVKINKNGRAGWEGTAGSYSGNIVMRNIEIGWNGCGERLSTLEPYGCWAQDSGGYGDGFGTQTTGGKWLIEDAYIHHNTSDGLDMRYNDGADSTHATIRRVLAVANAGNQIKLRGNGLIENSIAIGHCTFFRGKYNMLESEMCRAYGTSILLILTGNDTVVVRHNTVAGEGDVQIAWGEGTSTDKIYVQNNAVVGFPYYRDSSVTSLFTGGGNPGAKYYSGNLVWKARGCPSGTICNADPKFSNMTLAGFNAQPLSGSAVIDRAPLISAVTTDFSLKPRPSGAAADIGAIEVQAGVSTTTTTLAPTTTTLAPTTTTLAPTTTTLAPTTTTNPAPTFVSTPVVSEVTATSVKISWSLSEPATGQVQYGLTTSYGLLSVLESSFNFSTHIQMLSGLSPSTVYHYRIISKDAGGKQLISGDRTFKTAAAITAGPSVISLSSTAATIQWSVSEPATGQVQYGTTTSYGKVSTLESSYSFSTHKQKLSSLARGTTYHYRVVSKTANGTILYSSDKTFTTPR